MEEPKSPRKKNRNNSDAKRQNNFNYQFPSSIFQPEEIERISSLIYEEKNKEFIKIYEDYLYYLKMNDPKLNATVTKMKVYLSRKRSLINTLDSNYSSVNFLLTHLKEMYSFEKYHFVELFIFFHEFITYDKAESEYILDKKSFIMVNSCLFSLMVKNSSEVSGQNEDFEKKMLKDVFKYLKTNENMHLDSLIFYLRELGQSEITEENIFGILDKGETGVVSEKEMKEIIRGVQEFVDASYESSRTYNYLDDDCSYVVDNIFTCSEPIEEQELLEILKEDSSILHLLNKIFNQAEEIIMKMVSSKSPKEIANLLKGKDDNKSDSHNSEDNYEQEEEENIKEEDFEGEDNSFFKNNRGSSPMFNIGEETIKRLPYLNATSEKLVSFGSQTLLNSNKTSKMNEDTIEEHIFLKSASKESAKDHSKQQDQENTIIVNKTDSKDDGNYARKISFGSDGSKNVNNSFGNNHILNSTQNKNLEMLKKLKFNISPISTSNVIIETNYKLSSDNNHLNDEINEIANEENNDNINENDVQININDNRAFDFLDRESEDPLLTEFFDTEKFNKFEKIKVNSCLYDIYVHDFLKEILTQHKQKSLTLNQTISKPKFIDCMLNIINKYTHCLHLYSRIKALDDFYDLLSNYDLSQEIHALEIVGASIILCKGKHEDKIGVLFDFLTFCPEEDFKIHFILIISGILKLAFKSPSSKEHYYKLDSKIIGETIYETIYYKFNTSEYIDEEGKPHFSEEQFSKFLKIQDNPLENRKESYDINNLNLKNVFLNFNESANKNIESASPVNNHIDADSKIKIENEMFLQIIENLEKVKNSLNISDICISEAVDIIKSKSLIGYINKPQFVESLNLIIDDYEKSNEIIFVEEKRTEKINLITESLKINSNNTQLFELVEIISPLIILLKGRTEDKAFSILKIFDKDADDLLTYPEISSFLYHTFYFIFSQNNISNDELSSLCESLVKIIAENIFSNFKISFTDGINMKQLLEYYFLLI